MTLTLKVPPELALKLEAVAARKRIPKSKFVRDALITALSQEKEEPSLYDLMKDGIGCIKSGQRDLSTNPKHMEGFGQWRK